MCHCLKHRVHKVAIEIEAPRDVLGSVNPETMSRLSHADMALVDTVEEYTESLRQTGDTQYPGFEVAVAVIALGQRFLHEMPSPLATRVLMLARTFNRHHAEGCDGKVMESEDSRS